MKKVNQSASEQINDQDSFLFSATLKAASELHRKASETGP